MAVARAAPEVAAVAAVAVFITAVGVSLSMGEERMGPTSSTHTDKGTVEVGLEATPAPTPMAATMAAAREGRQGNHQGSVRRARSESSGAQAAHSHQQTQGTYKCGLTKKH